MFKPTGKPANSTVFEAVVELTGKLKQEFSEFKEKNEEFGDKVDATFKASQENTMKLQMVENQSRLQQACSGGEYFITEFSSIYRVLSSVSH